MLLTEAFRDFDTGRNSWDEHSLSEVVSYYNRPDTDERDPTRYPEHPANPQVEQDPNLLTNAFQARHNTHPADMTSDLLPHGVEPTVGRTAHWPLYIEAQTPEEFKPPKPTLLESDLRGGPEKYPWVVGTGPATSGIIREHVNQYTKTKSGNGALNHYWPGQKALSFGFANGAKMTPRFGGFHPRQRIWKQDDMKKARKKQLYFRMGLPSTAVNRFGSIEQKDRPATIGHVRFPNNVTTREWHRPPAPTSGLAEGPRQNPFVVLPRTFAQEQQVCWAAPAASVNDGKEALRIRPEERNVRPKHTGVFSPFLFSQPQAVEGKAGPQDMNPAVLRNSTKILTAGEDVMRPGNPSAGFDAGADVRCSCCPNGNCERGIPGQRINHTNLRDTQKDEVIHYHAIREPNMDRPQQLALQFGGLGNPVNRKVTPVIVQDVDPSLIDAWKQNPYTNPPLGSSVEKSPHPYEMDSVD